MRSLQFKTTDGFLTEPGSHYCVAVTGGMGVAVRPPVCYPDDDVCLKQKAELLNMSSSLLSFFSQSHQKHRIYNLT